MIRTVWVALVAALWTLAYGGDILLRKAVGSPGLKPCCRRVAKMWCRRILRAAGTVVEVEGSERLAGGEQVVVSNHESWFDVLALSGHLPVDVHFVAKQELARVPIFGPAWKACGHISIDREDREAAVASLEEAARQIREDDMTIVMFPEGTRSRHGELQPFKKGAFVLAIQAGAPVVPVGISGSRDVLPKGSWRVRRGTIRVKVGEPIDVRGLEHRHRDRLVREARRRVAALREGQDPKPGPQLARGGGPRAEDEGDAGRPGRADE